MILENKDIKVEYELDEKGNIVKSTISKQKAVKKETALERLKEYFYVDQELGITLEYEVKTDTVVGLNVKGTDIPNLAELKLLVWLVEDYVESVTISDGWLYIHFEELFFDDDEVIDKDLLDLFSEGLIDNIKEFKKGKEEFIVGAIGMFKGAPFSELKQLVIYIKDTLC